jgi:starvation-inducible DNA-binding protein
MKNSTLKNIDNSQPHIGINREDRADVAVALSSFTADTYAIYLKTLYYHWNVTGSNFYGLHKLFEAQYEELSQAGDALAERIRALGYEAPGGYKKIAEMTRIEEDISLPKNPEQMIKNLLKANEECSNQARKVLEEAEKVRDEVTVDMMVARMTYHEETAWMLRSTLTQ